MTTVPETDTTAACCNVSDAWRWVGITFVDFFGSARTLAGAIKHALGTTVAAARR